ncbi:transcriptional regulator [Luteipulveratus halotolerans]|uniref:Transcriptional regulator n=1 Tax=Luteipulveratus halotolerans TaxID=1631356 RepID=A0A0L6CDL5_9MICO|nr:transcriptional regulator [Luteipulveratus halotolerans]
MSHAIFRVARLHKMLAGQLLRSTGLYPGQELLMMRLWDEGPQRQVDLVRSLDSDAPTMARTIKRLERAGYVRRTPDPSDGRAALIEATPASLPLRRAVEQVWSELEALTVAGLDDQDRGRGQGQPGVLASLEALELSLLRADHHRDDRRKD